MTARFLVILRVTFGFFRVAVPILVALALIPSTARFPLIFLSCAVLAETFGSTAHRQMNLMPPRCA